VVVEQVREVQDTVDIAVEEICAEGLRFQTGYDDHGLLRSSEGSGNDRHDLDRLFHEG
jgi:hypothetical protein